MPPERFSLCGTFCGTDHAKYKPICRTAALELLFWVLFYYNMYGICNYTSADLSPQLFIRSGAVKHPGVIPVDSD